MRDVFLVKYQRLSDWIKQKLRRKANSTELTRDKLRTAGHRQVKNERSEASSSQMRQTVIFGAERESEVRIRTRDRRSFVLIKSTRQKKDLVLAIFSVLYGIRPNQESNNSDTHKERTTATIKNPPDET